MITSYRTIARTGVGEVEVSRSRFRAEARRVADEDEARGDLVKDVVSAIRAWKAEKKLPLNKEIELLELVGPHALSLQGYETDILETARSKELKIVAEAALEEKVTALKPVKAKVGPTFREKGREVLERLEKLDLQEGAAALDRGELELTLSDGSEVTLDRSFVEVQKKLTLGGKAVDTLQVGDVLIALSP